MLCHIQSRKDIQISSKSRMWDIIIIGLIFCIIIMLSQATHTMGKPFNLEQNQEISLATNALSEYDLRSLTPERTRCHALFTKIIKITTKKRKITYN